MANIVINPAEDKLQGWDTSGNVPAEGTIFEIVKSVIAQGASMSIDYNAATGRITINPRIASSAEVNAGATNNAVLTPSNLGGLTRLSNLAENLRKAIGFQGQRNGSSVGTRGALNLIPGTGINITMADDSANDRINATISMASGGSGVWIGGARRTTAWSPTYEARGINFSHYETSPGAMWARTVFTFPTPQPDTNYIAIGLREAVYELGGSIDPYAPPSDYIPTLSIINASDKTTTGFNFLISSTSLEHRTVSLVLVFR